MKLARLRIPSLVALALPLLVVACSDATLTSPDAGPLDAPQFSATGGGGGGTLYGADGAGGVPSTLYTLDPGTGAATPIGPIGFDGVRGLAFAPDGTLYGLTGNRRFESTPPYNELITIDPVTGAGTFVGLASRPDFLPRYDISVRNSDGALFVSGVGFGPTYLATFDTGTGAPTILGDIGVRGIGNGIAFSNSDMLYHAHFDVDAFGYRLNTLDTNTGVATHVADLTFAGFPSSRFTDLVALAVDPATDDLYAAVNAGSPASAGPNYLARIDPATGEVTNIGLSVQGLAALAWSGSAADDTPPTVTAELVPVGDKSLKSKKGRFEVRFSCEDDCDPDATPTATLNDIPVENGQVVDLRLKSAKSGKSDKSDKSKKSNKSGKSGKSDKPMKIEGPSFELMVICVDESGNEGMATASPQFAEKSKKSKKSG